MRGKKYGTVLTVIIILVILLTLFLIVKLIIDFKDKERIKREAEEAIVQFDKKIEEAEKNKIGDLSDINPTKLTTDMDNFTYGGYNMMGYIEIPKIKVKYPVLEKVTTHSLDIAVAILYGAGLNQVGNTVIVGHNYRNGLFFSDLKKLVPNDIVYIKDRSGTRLKYKVYNVFSTTPEDTSFYNRDTEGKREITLSTCSDSVKMRTIVLAREVTEEEQQPNIFNTNITINSIVNTDAQNNNQNNNDTNTTVDNNNNTQTQNTTVTNEASPFTVTKFSR